MRGSFGRPITALASVFATVGSRHTVCWNNRGGARTPQEWGRNVGSLTEIYLGKQSVIISHR